MAVSVYVRSLSQSDNKQRCFSKITVSKDEETTTWSIDGGYEPPFPDRKHKVVGYCKGLFCLEFENGKTLLWNPSNKEFKFLPPSELKTPPCPSPNCPIMDCSVRTASGVRGLGFDPKSGDYKVVTLAANFYSHSKYCYSTKQVEVYSLKDDCWKEIGSEGDENYIIDDYGTYLDGFCYWIAQTYLGNHIISLNLSNNEFSRVSIPTGISCLLDPGPFLAEYQNSLAFIYYEWGKSEWRTYNTMSCWVRKSAGEWIEIIHYFKFRGAEKPLGFCGDVLMFEGLDGELMVYDSREKVLSVVEGIRDYSRCMCISPFVKSKVHLSAVKPLPYKKKRKEMMVRKQKVKKKNKKAKEGEMTDRSRI